MKYLIASAVVIVIAAAAVGIARPWHAAPVPASPPGPQFSVVRSPDGVLVRDTSGAWLLSRRRSGSGSTDIVIGLPKGDGFPAAPSNPFGTGELEVALASNLTIKFSPASMHHVLVVTEQGCTDAPRTPPATEIAAAVDSVSAQRTSIRAAASQLASVGTGR